MSKVDELKAIGAGINEFMVKLDELDILAFEIRSKIDDIVESLEKEGGEEDSQVICYKECPNAVWTGHGHVYKGVGCTAHQEFDEEDEAIPKKRWEGAIESLLKFAERWRRAWGLTPYYEDEFSQLGDDTKGIEEERLDPVKADAKSLEEERQEFEEECDKQEAMRIIRLLNEYSDLNIKSLFIDRGSDAAEEKSRRNIPIDDALTQQVQNPYRGGVDDVDVTEDVD